MVPSNPRTSSYVEPLILETSTQPRRLREQRLIRLHCGQRGGSHPMRQICISPLFWVIDPLSILLRTTDLQFVIHEADPTMTSPALLFPLCPRGIDLFLEVPSPFEVMTLSSKRLLPQLTLLFEMTPDGMIIRLASFGILDSHYALWRYAHSRGPIQRLGPTGYDSISLLEQDTTLKAPSSL